MCVPVCLCVCFIAVHGLSSLTYSFACLYLKDWMGGVCVFVYVCVSVSLLSTVCMCHDSLAAVYLGAGACVRTCVHTYVRACVRTCV